MSQERFQIKLDLDPVTFGVYKALDKKQRKNLKKLIKLLILAAAENEDLGDVLKLSYEIKFDQKTLEKIHEIINGRKEKEAKLEEALKEAYSVLKTLHNIANMSKGDCYFVFQSNPQFALVIQKLQKLLE